MVAALAISKMGEIHRNPLISAHACLSHPIHTPDWFSQWFKGSGRMQAQRALTDMQPQ